MDVISFHSIDFPISLYFFSRLSFPFTCATIVGTPRLFATLINPSSFITTELDRHPRTHVSFTPLQDRIMRPQSSACRTLIRTIAGHVRVKWLHQILTLSTRVPDRTSDKGATSLPVSSPGVIKIERYDREIRAEILCEYD